jgi:molecular chaperone GrpE
MSEPKEQVADLQKQFEAEKQRSEEYLSRLKYAQADFENLKKRVDREIQEVRQYCTERIMLELLEVVDELELAVKMGEISADGKTLLEGVKMTLKKLRKVLEQEGVSPIECEGRVFDPTKHHAVETVEREGVEKCIVGEEVRKGYMMRNRVIRPSIVKVEAPASQDSKSQKMEENKKNE